MKFHENRSKSSGDMEWTRNSSLNPLTLTLSPGSWVMCYVRCFTKRNIHV